MIMLPQGQRGDLPVSSLPKWNNTLVLFRLIGIFAFFLMAPSTFAQVSGRVFKDFNANGVRDSTITYLDRGWPSATVSAYNSRKQLVATAISNAEGYYTLKGVKGDLRVVITLPQGHYSGFSGQGGSNSTEQAFVKAPATGIDFGISEPNVFCQPTPPVAVPCYGIGSGKPLEKAIVVVPYDAEGQDPSLKTMLNTPMMDMGAIWGAAYQKTTSAMFVSSFMKRHSFFGKGGTGAIYLVRNANKPATSSTEIYLDLKKFGIDTGDDPHQIDRPDIDAVHDGKSPFKEVGMVSFGDLDISPDEKYLYVVNLKDRKLYQIFIDNPMKQGSEITKDDIKAFDIPKPCDSSKGEARPFGLAVTDKKVYVGVVCDASISKDSIDLRASVQELEPFADTPTWNEALGFPLNYTKGIATGELPNSNHWNPWAMDWSPTNVPKGLPAFQKFIAYPTPMLSDIEIDFDGSIMLAFMDRFSHQVRFAGYDAHGKAAESYGHDFDPRLGGDLLRASFCDGQWVLESNSEVCNVSNGTRGKNNRRGPDGGEFYYGAANDPLGHQEVSVGALALIPGRSEVILAATDPVDMYSAGLIWLSNLTGAKNRGYEILSGLQDVFNGENIPFGKASSLGDMVPMCDISPTEIGNRVWLDLNGDSQQDAGEPPIANVEIELINEKGVVVGRTKTDAKGQYYFNHLNTVDTLGVAKPNVLGPQPKIAYQIFIRNITGGGTQGPLQQTLLTRAGFGPKKADVDTQAAQVDAVTDAYVDGFGQNDHTYDFGFCPTPTFDVDVVQAQCDTVVWKIRNNATLKIKNVRYAEKVAFSLGDKFTGSYADAVAIAADSVIVDTLRNPSSNQVWTIRVWSGGKDCYSDKQITLTPAKPCVQVCPKFTVSIVPPTCDIPTAQVAKNGKILLGTVTNGHRVGYSVGSTYTGPTYANAKQISLLSNKTLVDTLSNPTVSQDYTVRVFNLDGICFTDQKITLTPISCRPPCALKDSLMSAEVYNNKTPTDTTDDYTVLCFKASNAQAGASKRYEIVLADSPSGYTGVVLNPGGTAYGVEACVGYDKKLKANKTNKIIIRDLDYPACFIEYVSITDAWQDKCVVRCLPIQIAKLKM